MSHLRVAIRDQRGFTLAELLVVTAVLGLILAGVVSIQMQGQQAYLFGSHRVEVQQNNRAALELIVRELRSADSVKTLGSATDLTFQSCQSPYSAPTTPCNTADIIQVRYQLSGTTLNRTVTVTATSTTTTTPLIGGVQTLSMTYYSAWNGVTNSGTTTTVPGNVKLINIRIVTGTEDAASAGSPANQRATMESLVRLRNIL